jgi:hypothetical protein
LPPWLKVLRSKRSREDVGIGGTLGGRRRARLGRCPPVAASPCG